MMRLSMLLKPAFNDRHRHLDENYRPATSKAAAEIKRNASLLGQQETGRPKIEHFMSPPPIQWVQNSGWIMQLMNRCTKLDDQSINQSIEVALVAELLQG